MRNQHKQSPSVVDRTIWLRLPILGAALLLAGCAQFSFPPTAGTSTTVEVEAEPETAETSPLAIPEPQEDPEPGKLYEWNGTGRDISHVVIDTNEQRARFYDGQEQVGWTTIASGVSSHPTPSGEFQVMEKVAKKRSNLYGRIYNANGGLHKRNARSSDPIPAGGKFLGARMPHFMRMTYDGIGMHAGAIPRPGQPASHGCIRLPSEVASSLFAHTDIGTRVTVIGNGPDYGNYAERIRRQREQEKLARVAVAKAEPSSNASKAGAKTGLGSTQRPTSSGTKRSDQPATNQSPDTADAVSDASPSGSTQSASESNQPQPAASTAQTGDSGNAASDNVNTGSGAEDAATASRAQTPARSRTSASGSSGSSGGTADVADSETSAAAAQRGGTASAPPQTPVAPKPEQVSDAASGSGRAPEPETRAQDQRSEGPDSAPGNDEQPAASSNAQMPSPTQQGPTAPPPSAAPSTPQIRSADGGTTSDPQG